MKWRSLPIYALKEIYRKLELRKVLDSEFDTRNSPIDELSVAQLRHECDVRGLDSTGIKVISASAKNNWTNVI